MKTTSATVKVKDKASGKIVAEKTYTKIVFDEPKEEKPEVLLRDCIAQFQKDVGETGNGVLAMLTQATYGRDLGERSNIRQGLVAALEGPDKAVNRAVDALIKAYAALGRELTREAARKLIPAAAETPAS